MRATAMLDALVGGDDDDLPHCGFGDGFFSLPQAMTNATAAETVLSS